MPEWSVDPSSQQPFVRYRRMLRSWFEAQDDEWFVDRVGQLDAAVAEVDGHGFEVTPYDGFQIHGATHHRQGRNRKCFGIA